MENILTRINLIPKFATASPPSGIKRYTVDLILDLLTSGMTEQEILDDYPALEKEDIYACLAYAAKLTKTKSYTRTA